MGSVEDLRREKARLEAQREVRSDFAARDRERSQLKREISILKHPKRTAFLKASANFGSSLSGRLNTMSRPQPRRRTSSKAPRRTTRRVGYWGW